jgi:hypothetical protein
MLALAISGVIAAVLGRPYGDVLALAMGRLFVTIICLIVIWQLGWLDIAGITRSGDWLV